MKQRYVKDRLCLNEKCPDYGIINHRNIIRHSMYRTKQGHRRRFLCKTCGKTFCSTKGTPYYRIHKSRSNIDDIAEMTVEGINQSSISRIKRIGRNTICRWQGLASQAAQRFITHKLSGIEKKELQADEIQSFVGKKKTRFGFLHQLKSGLDFGFLLLLENELLEIQSDFWRTRPKDVCLRNHFCLQQMD